MEGKTILLSICVIFLLGVLYEVETKEEYGDFISSLIADDRKAFEAQWGETKVNIITHLFFSNFESEKIEFDRCKDMNELICTYAAENIEVLFSYLILVIYFIFNLSDLF